jgi:hypothetical protein
MPPETDNLQLEELFQQDQEDRQKVYDTPDAVERLRQRDAARRKRLSEMIDAGEVRTKNDLFHAAILLHHGDTADDFLACHRFSSIAALMGHKTARWLMAASLDRCLMALGHAQVYGTQFEYNNGERKYELRLPTQERWTLDFEKKFLGVPSIPERLAELNRHLESRKERA